MLLLLLQMRRFCPIWSHYSSPNYTGNIRLLGASIKVKTPKSMSNRTYIGEINVKKNSFLGERKKEIYFFFSFTFFCVSFLYFPDGRTISLASVKKSSQNSWGKEEEKHMMKSFVFPPRFLARALQPKKVLLFHSKAVRRAKKGKERKKRNKLLFALNFFLVSNFYFPFFHQSNFCLERIYHIFIYK